MIIKKTFFVGLFMVGILLAIPIMNSSSIDNPFLCFTGLFSKLITGMAGGIDPPGCPCRDGTLPGECSEDEPSFMCIQEGDDCSLVSACEMCECPEENPYCYPGGGIAGLGVCGSAPPTICGDGIINQDCEECDDSDLGDLSSCQDHGFDSGDLVCAEDCTYDTSGCTYNPIEEGCTDGTLLNSCSVTKPLFCDSNSELINKCSSCGCPVGKTCNPQTNVCESQNNVVVNQEEDEDGPNYNALLTCSDIGGYCTDVCSYGEIAYNEDLLDVSCAQSFNIETPLICCVPVDIASESDNSGDVDNSNEESNEELSKKLEQYLQEKEVYPNVYSKQSSPLFVSSFQRLFNDLHYAMGASWVVFLLFFVVIGLTYYLHGKLSYSNKKKRKRR